MLRPPLPPSPRSRLCDDRSLKVADSSCHELAGLSITLVDGTEIGHGAFIGSNSALVAPVKIGDGAIVGAGSVVTADVEANALGIARAPQQVKPGWARRFREAMAAKKAAK